MTEIRREHARCVASQLKLNGHGLHVQRVAHNWFQLNHHRPRETLETTVGSSD